MIQKTPTKVATRLAFGFGMTVVMGITIALLAAWELRGLANDLDEVAHVHMVKVQKFSELKDNLNANARYAQNILIDPTPETAAVESKKIADTRADSFRLLGELDKLLVLPAARELLKTITETRTSYNTSVDVAMALALQGKAADATKTLTNDVRPKQNVLFKAVGESNEFQRNLARSMAEEAMESATSHAVWLLAMTAAMGMIGAAVGWSITRSVSQALGAEPDQVSTAVQRIADGDLTTPVDVRPGDTASTMATVQRLQQTFAGIVGRVRGNAESVATASSQIAQGNHDLSQRTEEQASALQQAAATMDELGSTVRTTADNAQQANQLARNASDVASRGGEVVGQVVDTMKAINDSSRKVSDIIGVIDGIAFQTNILALNAAVEAARAGEQGRGFAVVASEVRSLAQRSAEAAKEIKVLIGGSVEQVERGTALVDRAGKTMAEIVGSIQRVSDIVGEISAATSEQSSGISQVGQAVSEMDQVTQQNAALVEESAAAAESLKAQAGQLVATVSVFQLTPSDAGRAHPAQAL